MAEYEARQQQDNMRRRRASEEVSRDAKGSHTGKNRNAETPQASSATNRGTNGSAHSSTDLEMKDHRADDPVTEAVNDERATEDDQSGSIPSHETTADEPTKDDDENGEDIVEEAAEDTVIY